jgi:large subunit ribosomal protein L4
VFVGGGTVFGPRPRNYDIKVNKKVRKLARRSAFSYKAKEGNIIVLEKFAMEQPKTKEYAKILANLGLDGSKSLFIIGEEDANLVLSSRNVQRTKVLTVNQLGTYEILHANKVVISEDAIEKLEASLN